jgi:zinc protease
LPNGVRSVVKQAPGAGLVAVQVWVRAGSRHEASPQAGAAHLVAVAALRSSRGYSAKNGGVTRAISGLGGESFSQTVRDSTNYSATVAARFLPDTMRALADATLHPDLSDAALKDAKTEARTDIRLRESDPLSVVSDLSYAASFSKHPYRRAAFGSEEDLEVLTPARVRSFFASRYSGSNISVVLVGDVTAARAHQLTAQFFGAAPRAAAGAQTVFGTPETAPLPGRTVRRTGPIARSTMSLSFRAPGMSAPDDVVATDVLLSYWNEGREAQMRKELLGESNLDDEETSTEDAPDNKPAPIALGLDISYLTQRDPSLMSFALVAEPQNAERASQAIFAEIARVQRNGVGSEALERAKRELRRQYIAQGETAAGQAGALGFYEMIGTYDFAVTYIDRINRITSADIKRVANRYLGAGRYVRVLIEPEPRPEAPLGEGVVPV